MKFIVIPLILIALSFFQQANAQTFGCNKNDLQLDKVYSLLYQIDKNNKEYKQPQTPVKNWEDTRAAQYEAVYRQCIDKQVTSSVIARLNTKQQHRLFTVLYKIVYLSRLIDSAYLMQSVVSTKLAQSQSVDSLLPTLHKAYVTTRQFDKASELQQRYPNVKFSYLPPIQRIQSQSSNERGLLKVDKDQQRVVQKLFEFPEKGHLIVVSSPICNPCRRALKWFKSQPELLQILRKQSTWITPVFAELYFDELIETNQKYAPITMQYTYEQEQWPEIEYWGTPSFYFYYDGKLVSQLVGWPKKGREKELRHGLAAVGLL